MTRSGSWTAYPQDCEFDRQKKAAAKRDIERACLLVEQGSLAVGPALSLHRRQVTDEASQRAMMSL
jgi:hypothetical protein